MRIRDIEIVLAVADLGSFTKAADRLGLSQPAISLAVKRFEDSVGIKLFERDSAHLKVSPAGGKALRELRKIHDIYQFSLGRGAGHRRLNVGLSSLLGNCDGAQIVERLGKLGNYAVSLEYSGSDDLQGRSDLDVAVYATQLTTDAGRGFWLETGWIGAPNGVFIYSRQEHGLWDAALQALRFATTVDRIVEVNDCVFAYLLAAAGAGMTPCVLQGADRVKANRIQGMPDLPAVHFSVLAEDRRAGRVIEECVGVSRDGPDPVPPHISGRRGRDGAAANGRAPAPAGQRAA